jgi:hypothetical protein
MVMRRAFLGALIHMRQDTEAKLRIFIEYLTFRHVVTEVGIDKLFIFEDVLQECADLLATCGARIGLEKAVTCSRKLFKRMAHK